MRKRLFVFLLVAFLVVVLCACGALGGSGNKKITQVNLTEAMVINNPTQDGGVYVYTGQPVTYPESSFTFEVNGNYPSASDFTYTYENNVNVGTNTAKVTITAKPDNPYCKGSVTFTFSIAPASIEVNTIEEVKSYIDNPNYNDIRLERSVVIEEEDTLTVPEGAVLSTKGNVSLTVNGTFTNNGKIRVNGTTWYQGGSDNGVLYVNGTFINNGSVVVSEQGEVFVAGTFTQNGTVENSGIIYANDSEISKVTTKKSGTQYIRNPLSSDNISLYNYPEGGAEYSQSAGGYRPVVAIENNAICTVSYENDNRVGVATVTVTAKERDRYFYGSVSQNYTILPGKAFFADYNALKAAIESGNYDRYEMTGANNVVIPAEETLTIRAGEVVNLAGKSLTAYGELINNGTLKCYKNDTDWTFNITIDEGGSIGGTGNYDNEKINMTVKGDFSLAASQPMTVLTWKQTKGTLTVDSELTVTTFSVGAIPVVIGENGSLTTETTSASFTLTNNGTFETANTTLYEAAVVTNTGSVKFGGETNVSNLNMTNNGTFINVGDMFIEKVTSFVNQDGEVNNEDGYIWTYAALENVNENVTVKKKLSAEIVELEYTEVYYDGTSKWPGITLEGSTPVSGDYTIKYALESSPSQAVAPSNAGIYRVTINFTNKKGNYGGSYVTNFEIKRSTINVATTSEFSRATTNVNYEKVIMTADITFDYSNNYYPGSAYLYSGITLDTNGYSLTFIRTNFTINGTAKLIVRAANGNSALTFYNDDKDRAVTFANYGTVESEGIVCLTSRATHYTNFDSSDMTKPAGTFLNNGTLYCGEAGICNVTPKMGSTGVVYERVPLGNLKNDFLTSYSETVYDGTAKEPTVSYGGSDTNVIDFFASFGITYSDNRNAGEAIVTIKPDLMNEKYFEYAELTFTINRAVWTVSGNFLYQSDFDDPDNYYEVKLSQNTTLTATVNVPNEMNVNLSYYTLGFENDARLVLDRDSVLVAEANSALTFTQNFSSVQKIVVTSDISTRIDLSIAISPNSGFRRMKYYSSGSSYVNTFEVSQITIDLNGHDLTGGIDFTDNRRSRFTATFVNSLYLTTTSHIGSASDSNYGFYQHSSTNTDTNFIFNNLTIAGIHMDGNSSGNETVITANDCTIERGDSTYALWVRSINADTNLTNCTLTTGNATIASIQSGDHVWQGCNLTSGNIWYNTTTFHKPRITIDGNQLPN